MTNGANCLLSEDNGAHLYLYIKAAPANTTTTTTASASSLPRRSFEIAKDQANKVYEITKDTVVAAVEGAKTGYVEKKRDSSKERKDASASAMSTDTI